MCSSDLNRGAKLAEVQDILGHASPATTKKVYAHYCQGARVQMRLSDDGYTIVLDAPKRLVLRPPVGYSALDVNGDSNVQPVRTLTAQAGLPYVIRAYK